MTVVMEMNKKYTDNLLKSSSETKTACPPLELTSLSPLENNFLSLFFFFFFSALNSNCPDFSLKKILPALVFFPFFYPFSPSSRSQPPPWRGGGVLGHASMHAARLNKSAPYSSQMLPTLQSGKKKVVKNAQNLDQNEGTQ